MVHVDGERMFVVIWSDVFLNMTKFFGSAWRVVVKIKHTRPEAQAIKYHTVCLKKTPAVYGLLIGIQKTPASIG